MDKIALPIISSHSVQKYYPLTENQRGIYIDWEMNRDTTQYNVPNILKFKNKTVENIESAVRAVFNAHSYLNTIIEQSSEDIIQKHSKEEIVISVNNLDNEPDIDFFQSRVRPFDLLNDRLYRVEIYSTPKAVYLFLDIHHIIFDNRSNAILIDDILSACDGKEIESEKITAYDFALHEKKIFASEVFTKAETCFDALVGDATAVNYPSSAKSDGKASGSVTASVSADIVDKFCKKNSVSANSFMQAAFAETLHRITREENPLYVTISNGRLDGTALQNTIGMFVKTLPVVLRSDSTPFGKGGQGGFGPASLGQKQESHKLEAENSESAQTNANRQTHGEQLVTDYVQAMHLQLQNSYVNDFYPYTKLVERHKLHASIMFIYHGEQYKGSSHTGNGIKTISLKLDTVNFPITINVYPDNEKYIINIEYDGMQYNSHDIQMLADAVANTAINMTCAERLKDVSIVSDEKKSEIIKLSTGKKLEYDKTQTWVDMFLHQATQHPDSVAVIDSESSITYRELDSQSDAVATYLLENGIKANDFVAIKMGRVKEFMIAVLGIHKVGATYVPIDADYPQDRIEYILHDSGAKLEITSLAYENNRLILNGKQLDTEKDVKSVNFARPELLAYMIYTSGSTGKPKGVMMPHRGMTNFIHCVCEECNLNENSRISCHSNFAFDVSVESLYPALTVGGSVFIFPEEARKDIDALRKLISDYRITGGGYSTAVGQLIAADEKLDVEYINLAGEKMTAVPNITGTVINGYGPTETCYCTFYKLEKDREYANIPIGRPLPNLTGYVVDQYGQLMPAGLTGELCISGPQVARGYWNRPELTAERFETLRGTGTEVYHTGDLVRYNDEGQLEYLGRIDFQVKLRGFRIELGEVDSRAAQFDGIRHVIAQVKKPSGTDTLVLYYSGEQQIDKAALKSFMAETLPEYMIPDVFMQLDEMPLTSNGKIDRKKLPEPELEATEIVAPANENEQKLFEIASDILKTDKFGVTTSLISMGMSSLMAMRYAAAIQKQINVKVSVADIMKHQTIRLIAENLDSENGIKSIKAYPKQELYPLTENQRGLYIDWELHKNTTQYNIPTVLKFADKTAEGLEKAVRTAFAAHGYLKTRFVQADEDVMQKPCDEETVILIKKLEEEPDIEFFQSRVKPFNLLNDRLYRLELYSAPKAVYLFMDIHHIIYDGLSSSVLMNDIMVAYDGKAVESEKITAYDFALYEKEILASASFNKAEKYFDLLVSDASVVNYPLSSSPDGKNGHVTISIPANTIEDYCKKNSVTENSFIHAAFIEIMHRVTREDNPLILTISNGRMDNFDLQNSMGMFVKTLPVVLKQNNANQANGANNANSHESALSHAEQKVSEYVQSIHKQLQESYRNDCYPYSKVVERHGIHANILIAYQIGIEDGNVSDLSDSLINLELDTVKFPIIMFVERENGIYSFTFEYDGMKYCRRDMEQLGIILQNTLVCMTLAEKIKDIKLLSDADENRVIELSKGRFLEYNRNETWVDLFRKQSLMHQDKEAVIDISGSITYSELDKLSDILANELIESGVGPESFVAVRMLRSKEFEIAVLGIHKAGAAYVPIDADYPQERIDYILQDSGAKFEITNLVYENGRLVVNGKEIASEKGDKPVNLAKPESLAYMIYTSGSTGKPKGVMMPHRGMTNFIHCVCEECNLNENSRISCHSNFAFDVSVESLYPALTVGGSVFIFPEEARKDIDALRKLISDYRITGGGYSTAVGQLIAADEKLDVEYINLAGEKMTAVPNITGTVINGYGPTETCYCTFYKLEKDREYANIPIGRPLPNLTGYVVDQYGQLMPAGLTGELCISGPQVALGYWNRPELTAERFETLRGTGTEVYHTGDLVRYNTEGQLEYLGRIDFQVKLRGFRIELGEVDSRAALFDGIRHVIAQVKKPSGTDTLVLYYSGEQQIDKTALKSFMAETLPEYMIPDVFMQLDEMPLTNNGKIDRKKLPEPELEATEIMAPANENEQKLFEIACDMLKTDKFGVTTSLISMGMSSLMSMKFAAAVQKGMNVKVSVADIMKYQNIRLIAENLGSKNTTINIKAYPKQELYPLTENQRGLYIDWVMHKNTTQYNLPMFLKFSDKTVEGLEKAIRTAFAAHSYLKTRFVQTAEDVLQKPFEEETVIFIKELEEEPDIEFFQSRVKPFDLLNDRLYRLELYSAPKAVYLFMDIHHIIYDGISISVLMNDIMAAYDGKSVESEKITAYDFALYEKEIFVSDVFSKAEARFDALVGDATAVNYPSSTKIDGKASGTVTTSVSADIVDKFCKKNSVTANSFMQAAFAETLHRITREENPLYVTISNGRLDGFALQNSMGMFVKTLPVVLKHNNANQANGANNANSPESAQTNANKQTHAEQSVTDYVQTMHQQLQESYAADFYPYTRIVERHDIHAGILFAYQGGIYESENISGKDFEAIELKLDTVKFPLMITVYPNNGKYVIIAEYDGNIYCEKDMQTLVESIGNMAVCMTSASMLKDCRLVTEEQEKTVLSLANGRKLEYDKTETIVTICRNRAAETPDATCVVYNGKSFTYKYIDEISDRLAVYLKEVCNVSYGDIVGVMIHRSELMVIYPLAIMKAGAAYMPLDTAFPTDRLEFMCNDAGLKVILTENGLVKEKLPEFIGTVFESSELASLKNVTKNQIASLPSVKPDDRMVILFTSGSTGTPKAVELEHHGIVNYCHWYADEFALTPKDNVAGYANFGFDAHMIDIYPSILSGAVVHILTDDIRKEIIALNDYFETNRITVAFLTTQIGCIIKDMNHSLRVLSTGGEKMPSCKNPGYRFLNVYGPTECSLFSTYYDIKGETDGYCIGRPLANYHLYVVDQNCQLVPQGVMGELLIAGIGVARGYMNRPELNAEKFIEFRPSASMPVIRAYRSGDLVRWNEDGNIDFIGRIDHQVKIRGLRIELGEIENRASEFGGMDHLIALVKTIGENPNICLYYSSKNAIDKEKLRAFMAEKLPDYMVPNIFMQLDEMPMTTNGKIDRKALPLPVVESKGSRLPETELEKKLCAIFAEVLGRETVYADDDFFKIGGSSISAMKLTAKCMSSGIRIVYADVFDNPKPSELAALIESRKESREPQLSEKTSDTADKKTTDNEILHDVLKYNCYDYLDDISYTDIGNVLVTGANGFLGIHVVKELIDSGCRKVYCLVRGNEKRTSEDRLRVELMYYFSDSFKELMNVRIIPVNGDITDKNLFDTLKDLDFDTVINCAAVVKHFTNSDLLDRVNFHGVENLADICFRLKRKLVQVSTVSVGGDCPNNCVDKILFENTLDIGQILDNKYAKTKYLAEEVVLQYVKKGLRAKIIRVGNLMGRVLDGEFQINFSTNNFMNTIKAFKVLGAISYDRLQEKIEFSPIDLTAKGIRLLAGTPDKFTVFHNYNCFFTHVANVIETMRRCGFAIKSVKSDEFNKIFNMALNDSNKVVHISSLIAYNSNNELKPVSPDNEFTIGAMYRLGFVWPTVSDGYLERLVTCLAGLGFFNEKYNFRK